MAYFADMQPGLIPPDPECVVIVPSNLSLSAILNDDDTIALALMITDERLGNFKVALDRDVFIALTEACNRIANASDEEVAQLRNVLRQAEKDSGQ